MATVEDLQAAFAQLQTDVTTALADLKEEIASIQGVDPAALQGVVDSIDALDSQVKAADPGAPPATA